MCVTLYHLFGKFVISFGNPSIQAILCCLLGIEWQSPINTYIGPALCGILMSGERPPRKNLAAASFGIQPGMAGGFFFKIFS
jgi:hypothetical protein